MPKKKSGRKVKAKGSELKKKSFGGCSIAKISPSKKNLPNVINVTISFEDALKLNLALEQSLRKLISYDMRKVKGKGVKIAVVAKNKNIQIYEGETKTN